MPPEADLRGEAGPDIEVQTIWIAVVVEGSRCLAVSLSNCYHIYIVSFFGKFNFLRGIFLKDF